MSNRTFVSALFVASLLAGAGCGGSEPVRQLSAEERFALGMAKFKNEDYLDALEDFKIVTLQYQGTKLADAAQFYLAECRYAREEYILAAYEYDVLMRTMPSSKYIPQARFRRATCFYYLSPNSYLDQDYTRKAIDEYQAFLEYFPTDTLARKAEARINELNTKLAKKEFENGITYLHIGYYKAATMQFDLVIEKYHDTPYAEQAHMKRAEALYQRKKYPEALQELQLFFSKYPASVYVREANELREGARSAISSEKEVKPKPVASPQSRSDQSRKEPQQNG